MNREELAWAAGFVDGEGHFKYKSMKQKGKQRSYGSLVLAVAQTAARKEVLDRLANALGVGKVFGPYHKEGRKPCFVYTVSRFEHTQYVIALLWSFLSRPKREQARDALLRATKDKQRAPLKRGPKKGEHVG